MTQSVVNDSVFQSEFGIKTGLPRRCCWRIQKANAGMHAAAIHSRTIWVASLMLDVLLDTTLLE